MKRTVLFLTALLAASGAASAQYVIGAAKTDEELLGLKLFNQSCQVCHTSVLLGGQLYGPALSQESLGGDAAALHAVIENGTERMPGWHFKYSPTQIDAIVAYLKTVPKNQAAVTRPNPTAEANTRNAE